MQSKLQISYKKESEHVWHIHFYDSQKIPVYICDSLHAKLLIQSDSSLVHHVFEGQKKITLGPQTFVGWCKILLFTSSLWDYTAVIKVLFYDLLRRPRPLQFPLVKIYAFTGSFLMGKQEYEKVLILFVLSKKC